MTNAVNRALSAYSTVDLESAVNSASPVQLIVLLYDGAIGALATAKGHMQEMQFAEKGRLISKATDIIEGLRAVLDFERGGEISNNLNALYEYMKHRLTLANLKNDRIYVFSGTKDTVVYQQAVDATVAFFKMAGVPNSSIN